MLVSMSWMRAADAALGLRGTWSGKKSFPISVEQSSVLLRRSTYGGSAVLIATPDWLVSVIPQGIKRRYNLALGP